MREELQALIANVGQVIRGKDEAIQLAIICLLAQGHLLIEDVPGVGKTSLASALASSLGSVRSSVYSLPVICFPQTSSALWSMMLPTRNFTSKPAPSFITLY